MYFKMSRNSKTLIFLIIFNLTCFSKVSSEIIVQKVDMRPPKRNDIGLMFDVTLSSTGTETAEIRIRPEMCCLSLSNNETMCEGSKMVGGYFGKMDHPATKVITIVWPTVTLYNRLGYCDICVVTNNITTDDKFVSHRVSFDTMIAPGKIPPTMREFVGASNISKCKTEDLNPLCECEPVICEEKYFGRRNFFNSKKLICEPVPNCSKSEIYDYIANECMDINRYVCLQDLEEISTGKYDNSVFEFSKQPFKNNDEIARYKNEITDGAGQHVLLEAIGHGLIMVCFGIGVYFFFCFCVFLIVLLCLKSCKCHQKSRTGIKL